MVVVDLWRGLDVRSSKIDPWAATRTSTCDNNAALSPWCKSDGHLQEFGKCFALIVRQPPKGVEGFVAAERVDHDDIVRPVEACEASGDVQLFVAREDDHRHGRAWSARRLGFRTHRSGGRHGVSVAIAAGHAAGSQ